MIDLLDIDSLSVQFADFTALHDISLSLKAGERLGLVGESGSGKSTLGLAVLGLLADGANVSGQVRFKGNSIKWFDDSAMTQLRGREIGFIHQDPMSAFSPVHSIGTHLIRAYRAAHPGGSMTKARMRAVELLEEVEITQARARLDHYPHEYSGGMRQRVMIAASLVGNPSLLIADEPTTALDVTTQAAVLRVINRVVEARGMGLILITHDLGVVAEVCQDVAITYRGKLIQRVAISKVHEMAHPYTKALLEARPRLGMRGKRLRTIAEILPSGWADA
jgi:ABC-type dipeptide/oligopeptide/nickel transport system ATPase component